MQIGYVDNIEFQPARELQEILVLEQHRDRILEVAADGFEEFSAGGSIDHAVVAGERHFHLLAGHDHAVLDNRYITNGPNGQDARVWRVDDGCELVNAKHAEVGRRKR